MKKTYVKPLMAADLFSLTQSIAANCSALHGGSLGTPGIRDKETCYWEMGDLKLFLDSMSICENPFGQDDEGNNLFPIDENTEVMGYCYNNPNGEGIFGS